MYAIDGVVERLRQLQEDRPAVDQSIPGMTITLATTVYYPSPVRVDEIERACGCVVPPELLEFWRLCGGARVFEDVLNGQWGLLLWTPVEVAVRSPDDTSSWINTAPEI